MATKKKYTRPRAVDLGLSAKKTPTRAQETGGKSKSSKTIAPTGRGKPITAAVATANIAKALYAADKKATAAAKSAGKGLYKAHTTTYKKTGQAIKAGAKALRPYTIFAKTKRAKSRVKK